VKDDDPQRTQEWSPRFEDESKAEPGTPETPPAGATAEQATAAAAAREAEAESRRHEADEAARVKIQTGTPAVAGSSISGASVMSPGVGSETDPAVAASTAGAYRAPVPATPGEESTFERPEVLAGAVFAGAFLVARIFKRLVD